MEWRAIGFEEKHWGIRGIFIDRRGVIRVVDGCPRFMTGLRVWLSRNNGRNWRIEKQIGDAWRDRSALLGPEKGKVLFSKSHTSTIPFRDWPLEVEELLKTEFRGLYEHRAPRSSALRFFLARDPNNSEIMIFCSIRATGAPRGQTLTIIRLFVTIDGGENWLEFNPPGPEQAPMTDGSYFVGGLAIARRGNVLRVFLGADGFGPEMVQLATLSLSEIRETLAKR